VATGNAREALKITERILTEFKNNKTDSLDVMIDERNRQKVPVLAAAHNMRGYIFMQQKNINKAKEEFFAALEIYPDYVMPKQNLEMIFARKY
jgi:tetratricopeptide (TPR) repeat protein